MLLTFGELGAGAKTAERIIEGEQRDAELLHKSFLRYRRAAILASLAAFTAFTIGTGLGCYTLLRAQPVTSAELPTPAPPDGGPSAQAAPREHE